MGCVSSRIDSEVAERTPSRSSIPNCHGYGASIRRPAEPTSHYSFHPTVNESPLGSVSAQRVSRARRGLLPFSLPPSSSRYSNDRSVTHFSRVSSLTIDGITFSPPTFSRRSSIPKNPSDVARLDQPRPNRTPPTQKSKCETSRVVHPSSNPFDWSTNMIEGMQSILDLTNEVPPIRQSRAARQNSPSSECGTNGTSTHYDVGTGCHSSNRDMSDVLGATASTPIEYRSSPNPTSSSENSAAAPEDTPLANWTGCQASTPPAMATPPSSSAEHWGTAVEPVWNCDDLQSLEEEFVRALTAGVTMREEPHSEIEQRLGSAPVDCGGSTPVFDSPIRERTRGARSRERRNLVVPWAELNGTMRKNKEHYSNIVPEGDRDELAVVSEDANTTSYTRIHSPTDTGVSTESTKMFSAPKHAYSKPNRADVEEDSGLWQNVWQGITQWKKHVENFSDVSKMLSCQTIPMVQRQDAV